MDQAMESKFKTFWQRPEGKTGMIVAAMLVAAGVIGLSAILPWLIALASNTLTLIGLLAAIGTILFLITNKQVQTLVAVGFQLSMRFLTGCIVKTDPLGILKIKVQEMESNLAKMSQSIGKLLGVLERLKRKISDNAKVMEASMKEASYAKKTGKEEDMYLSANKAKRRQRANATLSEHMGRIEAMHRVLNKIYKNSAVVIEDTKDEISVTEDEYKAVKEAHNAMSSAMAVLNGNPDRRAIYEMAYDQLADEIANKTGEIKHMMEMSDGLMNSIDVQNGMMAEDGLQMLVEWEKKADTWLKDSATKTDAVSKVSEKEIPKRSLSPEVLEVVENTNNQFSNLFNR
jgi:phage shock protein A